MTVRTPRELIEIYWDEVYNNGRTDLIREVCADPIIRHDPESVTPLSHDEQIERVERSLRIKPYFTHRVLHADERFVTSVWNMDSMEGKGVKLCGIEVFEAENGRFTRCWNSTYKKGFWGEDEDLFDPSKLTAPPLLESTGEITAQWMERALAAGGAVTPHRMRTLSPTRLRRDKRHAALRGRNDSMHTCISDQLRRRKCNLLRKIKPNNKV